MGNGYNGLWVESQGSRCAALWNECAPEPVSLDPQYSRRDHEAREIAYDAELRAVEWEARHAPRTIAARAETQERLIASFGQFAANALDLSANPPHSSPATFFLLASSLRGGHGSSTQP